MGPQAIPLLAFPFKEPLLLNTWKVDQIVTFSCRQSHSVSARGCLKATDAAFWRSAESFRIVMFLFEPGVEMKEQAMGVIWDL